MFKKLILLALIVMIAVPAANADRRKYVWTYQPITIASGDAELEFYQTTKINEVDSWEYRIEVESGLTDRWDFSVYQIFAQKENTGLKWDAFQIRTRYRLSEPGTVLFDPVLYLEYRRKTDSETSKKDKYEAKLLLGKDFENGNFSFNPVFEYFPGINDGDNIYELGLDVGLSYSPNYKVAFGLESTTRYEKEGDISETGSYFGPTVSYSSGKVWYTAGIAWGITDDSNNARARLLIGVGL